MNITVVNVRGEKKVNGNVVTLGDTDDGYAEAPDIEALVNDTTKLARDEMKKIADDNDIEYQPNIKTEKLRELVKDFI